MNGKTNWVALRRMWKAYRTAKANNQDVYVRLYAAEIKKIQKEMNLAVESFPEFG